METLMPNNNMNELNNIRINIINQINILITKIQKNYIFMLENTKKVLNDIKMHIFAYNDYNILEKYIKNKNNEIEEFVNNVRKTNS